MRLLVNRGEPALTYVMPDVTGTEAERAADALRQQGLLRVTLTTVPAADRPPGAVMRQQPAAGAQVATTDMISLEVSR